MDSLIYQLPTTQDTIAPEKIIASVDYAPSPRLLKYGYNHSLSKINMREIYDNPHHYVGLSVDYQSKESDNINTVAKKIFGKINVTEELCCLWEIVVLLEIFNNVETILTNRKETMEIIAQIYSKLKNKKIEVFDFNETIKDDVQLVIYLIDDVDESVSISMLLNALPKLLSVQQKGAQMIFPLANCQTQLCVELLYYLTSIYNTAYLTKLMVSNTLSASRFVVLQDKKDSNKKIPEFNYPKKDYHLITLGLSHFVTDNFVNTIQCCNSAIDFNILRALYEIKKYISEKVFEGASYQVMLTGQREMAKKWLEIVIDGPSDKTKEYRNKIVEKCMQPCNYTEQLNKLI